MMDVILWPVVHGQNAWARFRDEERGQGLVEYALIIALVALVVIAILAVLGGQIKGVFTRASSELSKAPITP